MKLKTIIISVSIFAALIIAFWLVSPLFINKTVNERLPVHDSEAFTIKLESQGVFVDADSFHKTSGTVKVVNIEGDKFLSLEDFQTANGPDLFVYLAKDFEAKDFVNLGELKGNIGNQNYEIPEEVDINSYNKVLIWCRAFGVLFGSAEI